MPIFFQCIVLLIQIAIIIYINREISRTNKEMDKFLDDLAEEDKQEDGDS